MTPHQFSSSAVDSLYSTIRKRAEARHDRIYHGDAAVRELVLNISEGGNLRCPYCFANDGTYHHDETRWMTEETVQETLRYAIDRFPDLVRVKLLAANR
jgi:sulfatase maturation enzyme AslB (radical SAM superfamily)